MYTIERKTICWDINQLSIPVSSAMGGDDTDIYGDVEKTNLQTEATVQEEGVGGIDRNMHRRTDTDDMGNDLRT